MLWRMPVNGAVMVEEARSLITGERDERQSGYLHTDIRGSTLAKTGWSAPMSLLHPDCTLSFNPCNGTQPRCTRSGNACSGG